MFGTVTTFMYRSIFVLEKITALGNSQNKNAITTVRKKKKN